MDKYLKNFNQIWQDKCSNYPRLPSILPPTRRIIVLGDIHGDFKQLKEMLRVGKVINTQNVWIGGDTVVVQLGDQIDSCRSENCAIPNAKKSDKAEDVKLLKYMTELHHQATKFGGAVYSVIGNHELMNVDGDMSYVSYKNIKEFDNYNYKGKNIKDGLEGRKVAFSPGNDMANFLACTRQMALVIGSNLFVHAGIVPQIARKYKVDDLNKILTLYLLDELKNPNDFNDIFVNGRESPLWVRIFGKMDQQICDNYMGVLDSTYQVGKIFVGHTPQIDKGINSVCNDRVWLADVGVSNAFDIFDTPNIKKNGYRKAQVLEIIDDNKITVLK